MPNPSPDYFLQFDKTEEAARRHADEQIGRRTPESLDAPLAIPANTVEHGDESVSDSHRPVAQDEGAPHGVTTTSQMKPGKPWKIGTQGRSGPHL